jgi:hypothetical protein
MENRSGRIGKNPITNELFYTLRPTGVPLAAIVGELVQPSGQNTAHQSRKPALTPELIEACQARSVWDRLGYVRQPRRF